MRQHLAGDAADDQGADTAAAVRSHDDEISADLIRFPDDLAVDLRSAGLIGDAGNAGSFSPRTGGGKRLGGDQLGSTAGFGWRRGIHDEGFEERVRNLGESQSGHTVLTPACPAPVTIPAFKRISLVSTIASTIMPQLLALIPQLLTLLLRQIRAETVDGL
jgi:hypothetical protein